MSRNETAVFWDILVLEEEKQFEYVEE